MCFYLKRGQFKAKIAEEDIPVWKRICRTGRGVIKNMYDKHGEIMFWEKGFEYEECGKVQREYGELGGGVFHSKKQKKDADKIGYHMLHKTVRMYIPKGTKYWENDTEYASKKLVWY